MAFLVFSSHDMFLKLDSHYLSPNSPVEIKLYNGTFNRSDNVITRDRMADVSIVGHRRRTRIDSSQWSDRGSTTVLSLTTGAEGTWVVGVSTLPRLIELTATDFNDYLEHDGATDMLQWRRENNALEQDAVEKYSKHVKTIYQVGEMTTTDWQTALGYPIEFMPLINPGILHAGESFEVELLWKGEPLANQLVYLGSGALSNSHEHHESEGHSHSHTEDGLTAFRTDASGHLSIPIPDHGIYYLKTIYLQHSNEPEITHESNWATLTFEVGHSHGGVAHGHEHDHSHDHDDDHTHEDEFPTTLFFVGSILIFGGLFFWFNRKKS